MLSINDLNLQYGSKHIFRNVSVQIHTGDRVGLAGVNGAGKSTLLKIMCGQQEVDPGIVNRASWFSVAYLPQEVSIEFGSGSLFAEAESAFDDVLAQQEELDRVSEELARWRRTARKSNPCSPGRASCSICSRGAMSSASGPRWNGSFLASGFLRKILIGSEEFFRRLDHASAFGQVASEAALPAAFG
jgi:energy-coupling factor transporter ATP-binding protein EcfA2